MALSFSMNSLAQLADITAMFTEYQIRGLLVEVNFMGGDSYNPGIGSPLPEIQTIIDPSDANTALNPQIIESFGNSTRNILSQERPVKTLVAPRPALQLYSSAVSSGDAYDASTRDLWFSTATAASTSIPFYGWKALIRNWCSTNGSGAVVRLNCTVQIALRRPH
jgi:hypothetical protein